MPFMTNILLFNPENDLALANGDPNFVAPTSARKLAADLETLPLWWHDEHSLLLSAYTSQTAPSVTGCKPWGWSAEARNRFLKAGIPESVLPSEAEINQLRMLSHRSTSIRILSALNVIPGLKLISEQPEVITTLDEAERYIAAQPQGAVLKTPWSSSGKGLCWSLRMNPFNRSKWLQPVFRKMGCVIAEPRYTRIIDFAMLFHASKQQDIGFVGYSLFYTDEQGAYQSNLLLSNDAILERLGYYINIAFLKQLQKALLPILSKLIDGVYEGYLGIDMMIVRDVGDDYLVHPCVELNLRMTMGGVARLFYDRYMQKGEGEFRIEHAARKGELLSRYPSRESEDAKWEEGLLRKGRVCLTPVTADTSYVAIVQYR